MYVYFSKFNKILCPRKCIKIALFQNFVLSTFRFYPVFSNDLVIFIHLACTLNSVRSSREASRKKYPSLLKVSIGTIIFYKAPCETFHSFFKISENPFTYLFIANHYFYKAPCETFHRFNTAVSLVSFLLKCLSNLYFYFFSVETNKKVGLIFI